MNDEQKIETTIGGLKEAFAKWHLDNGEDPDEFMTTEQVDALSPEDYGKVAAEYFIGILEQKDAPAIPKTK